LGTGASANGVIRQSGMVGDYSIKLNSSTTVTDLIQGMTADGFQIGLSAPVNASGETFYYVAFKDDLSGLPVDGRQMFTHTFVAPSGTSTGVVTPVDTSVALHLSNLNSQNTSLVTTAGVFRNLRVRLITAPGSGKSFDIALQVNGSDSALTFTIADTATIGQDVANEVIVAPGDVINLRVTSAGSPAGSGASATWTVEWDPDDGETRMYGGSNAHADGATTYVGVPSTGAGGGTFTLVTVQNVMPQAGAFTGVRIRQDGTNVMTATLVLNGIEQDGTGATVDTVAHTTGNGTTGVKSFSLPVSAGDLVALKLVCAAGIFGSFSKWGVSFVPTDNTKSPRTGSNFNDFAGSGVRYHYVGGSGDASPSATETDRRRYGAVTPYTLKDLFVDLPVAPGAGKSWTFTVLKNGAVVTGAPSVTIADADTTGSDTASAGILVEVGDQISLRCTPSGAPTDVDPAISWTETALGDVSGRLGAIQKIGKIVGTGSAQSVTGLGFSPEHLMCTGPTAFGGCFVAAGVQAAPDASRLADGAIRTAAITSLDTNGFTVGSEQSQASTDHWWQAFDTGSVTDPTNESEGGIFEADVTGVFADNGIAYESRVRSKQFVLGGILRRFGVLAGATLVTPASGESLSVKLIRDYGRETVTKSISLTPTGSESDTDYLLRQLDNVAMSDLISLQIEVTDSAGTFGWSMDQMVLKMRDEEGM
jgi:hypothetical protein